MINKAYQAQMSALADLYFAEQCARLGPIEGQDIPIKTSMTGLILVKDETVRPDTDLFVTFEADTSETGYVWRKQDFDQGLYN